MLRVEGADSQEPRRKHLRDRVDSIEGLMCDLAHIDGMRGTVRRVCRLVLEIEKKKFFAEFGVLHAYAAWHERIVSDDATSSQPAKVSVGHVE